MLPEIDKIMQKNFSDCNCPDRGHKIIIVLSRGVSVGFGRFNLVGFRFQRF